MIRITTALLIIVAVTGTSCSEQTDFEKDLAFLGKYDSVVVLAQGNAKVIVSPKYQAKVFTSTAGDGASYGWINYRIFDAEPDPHMNAYGGENRIWLGPEGGRYSLFFPRGFAMNFANWKIPSAFDTQPWQLVSADATTASMKKDMKLPNYSGATLFLSVLREVRVLDKNAIQQMIGTSYPESIKAVGYTTDNKLTNTGDQAWNDSTGLPCIWILDMFAPSPSATIVIPIKTDSVAKPANTSYFGEIPADRIRYAGNTLFFKADGKMRNKLGIPPYAAKNIAGSYDAQKKTLTLTLFDIDSSAQYLNQEWNVKKPVYSGDAINAYNDGPLEDGRQLGPFYELESVSPAAKLAPGQSLSHRHSVFHFTGEEKDLDPISRKTLGVSIDEIRSVFGGN